jgi:DNA invertase Pin-like site-specific DNA recombinase
MPLIGLARERADFQTVPLPPLMLTVLGGLAEFERELIRARTVAAFASAGSSSSHRISAGKPSPVDKQEKVSSRLAEATT